jgi:DNA-binding NtrC family response regulator
MAQRAANILIADDDRQVLKLFERILTREGYSVIAVNSDGAAAGILKTCPVDLVVLDLKMLEPDGFELLKSFRAEQPELPILVISGYLQGSLLQASEFLGAAGSLSKLEAPKKLAKTAGALLAQSAAGSR